MVKNKKQSQLAKIILTALLIAINVVLERLLAYSVWNQTISLGFIAVGFAAAFLGTPYAVAVAGLGDVIGSVLFPFGTYFPGFTLTNCVYGIILAEFLYKNATVIKIVTSVILSKIVCSLILNTLWVSIMYKGDLGAFFIVLYSRLPQAALMITAELIVLLLLFSNKSKFRHIFEKNFKKFI